MKILIIAYSIGGNSSSGKVVKLLLDAFIKRTDIEVSIISGSSSQILPARNFLRIQLPHRSNFSTLEKAKLVMLNKDSYASNWVKLGMKKIIKTNWIREIDCTLVIGSAYAYQVYQLAYTIHKKFGVPYHIHGLDPIPSVAGWGEHRFLRMALKRYIRPFYRRAQSISAISPEMVSYQTKVLGLKKEGFTVLNPFGNSNSNNFNSNNIDTEEINIAYIGSLNNRRTPNEAIRIFEEVRSRGLDVKLHFYGNITGINITRLCEENSWIVFHGYVKNPDFAVNQADFLLDIDANIENDVFVSGKLLTYISKPKPIVIITPYESPTHSLVKGLDDSICLLNYSDSSNSDKVYQFLNRSDYFIEERKVLIDKTSPSYLVDRLLERLPAGIK